MIRELLEGFSGFAHLQQLRLIWLCFFVVFFISYKCVCVDVAEDDRRDLSRGKKRA